MYKNLSKDVIRGAINESFEALNESAKWSIKESDKYDNNIKDYIKKVKKLKSFIEKEVNKTSSEVFNTFRDSFRDNISDYYKEDLEEFCNKNKKAPKIKMFEMECDYIDFILDGYFPHDFDVFYQDRLVKALNNNDVFKSKEIRFFSEDYSGIFIKLK